MISIVIPTCHRNEQLALCLDRLAPGTQTAASNLYRVIVTDDGLKSTAEHLIKTRFPWAQWTAGPRRGPAANRNHGASIATGEWLLFLDDDCLPSAGCLSAFERFALEEPNLQVIEGSIHTDRPKQRMDEVAPVNQSGGYLWSCNFAIKRSLFEKIGGFDEDFPYAAMEDVDLRERLNAIGVAIRFSKEASVCHPWRKNGGLTAVRKATESHRIFWTKHPGHLQNHPPTRYIVAAFKTILRQTIPEAFVFRAKGLSGSICNIVQLLELARLSFKMRFRQSPSRGGSHGGIIKKLNQK